MVVMEQLELLVLWGAMEAKVLWEDLVEGKDNGEEMAVLVERAVPGKEEMIQLKAAM